MIKLNIVAKFLVGTFALVLASGAFASTDVPRSSAADLCQLNTKCWISVSEIRPTQFAFGQREVDERAESYARKSPKKLMKILVEKVAPAIRGPGGEIFITDRHHLALILLKIGKPNFYVEIREDWSGRDQKAFEAFMSGTPPERSDAKSWLYDENDRPQVFKDLPSKIEDLRDDPFRSLAYYVEQKKCFLETKVLYAEFKWARFFREKISPKSLEADFDLAIDEACTLAKGSEAKRRGLPGTF